MGKRQIAALETRKKIIEATKKLVKEKGFGDITVDEIVAEAGVAKGSFYTYFEHKDDIYAEIARNNFTPTAERSMNLEGEVWERLSTFITESMQFIMNSGLSMAQEWMKKAVDPRYPFTTDKLEYDLGVIKEIISAAIEKGELKKDTPVDALGLAILTEYYGALMVWCMSNGDIDPIKTLEDYSAMQLKKSLEEYII